MILKIKAFPNSKKDCLIKKSVLNKTDFDDFFEIKIKAKPENNQANNSIIKLLAKYYNKDEKFFKLIKGANQKSKIILFKNN